MATEQTVFVRKYGDKAIIISIGDANDFKELFDKSEHENPDMWTMGRLTKNIYSGMQPTLTISNEGIDITNDTKGMGIDGILTGGSGCLWYIKKITTGLEGLIGG